MLKIKELKLSGIGRFVEEQTVSLESLGALVQVDGENRNTDGSSGSGKSTLFNALDYLLGLNDLPTTVLQSRLTKDPINVVGTFDWNGKDLVISRSKKGLKIEVNGVPTEGSSALTEAKLVDILGMPSKLFRKMLHKRQKEGGFFLDFTPKEMYEFLTDCLNLSDLRKKVETVDSRLDTLDTIKEATSNGLDSAKSALLATQEGILALGLAPIKDIHQPVIVELKSKYDLATAKFNETQEKQKNEIQELEKEKPQVSTPIFDRQQQNDLESKKKSLEEESGRIVSAERDRQAKASAAVNERSLEKSSLSNLINNAELSTVSAKEIAGQVKKIRDAICPTCDQTWITDSAKTKEAELIAKLAGHKEKIAAGAAASDRIGIVENELVELKKQTIPVIDPRIMEIENEIKAVIPLLEEEKKKADEFYVYHSHVNKAIMNEFADKVSALRTKQAAELDQARGQAEVDRRAFDAAVAKLKAYEEARTRYETSLASMQVKQTDYSAKIAELDQEMKKTLEEMEVAEELKRALKSFASVSFDEALEVVGDVATRIIRCIPNMSNATIQFEGQKETKEGKIKEEVNAVISMDGEIGIPIKSLSGGERSSVDLAVDLAVIDYLESKTGKGIDVFILDEPFTGLDTVSIENALEVLKNSNINKKLIIVDHNPEVKQMVSSRLVVVRDGQTSSIVQSEG